MAALPRQTLPALARAVGVDEAQAFHHFLPQAPREGARLRQTRLALRKAVFQKRPLLLCMDETGEKKKGQTTASGARQSSGHLGTMEPGIVAVQAYGGLDGHTLP
jgi:SRSO17 transposase